MPRAFVESSAQQRRHRGVIGAIFPGQRLMRLEILHRGLYRARPRRRCLATQVREPSPLRVPPHALRSAAPPRPLAPARRQNPASRHRSAASPSAAAGSNSGRLVMADSPCARSSTPAANSPTVSSVHEKHFTPTVGSIRNDGLMAATPQKEAGRITEPPVCVPSASGIMPAATAAAEPEDDPPGV